MSPLFLSFFALIAVLLAFFVWSLRRPSLTEKKTRRPAFLDGNARPNITFLPQIRQALSPADELFLVKKVGSKLAKHIQRRRKAVALAYLEALHTDFDRLLQQAKLIAVLSPEVVAMHEFERVRLSLEFSLRCALIRARIALGAAPILELGSLSDVVSGITIRIESAMRQLAERAAVATDIASPLQGGGVGSN